MLSMNEIYCSIDQTASLFVVCHLSLLTQQACLDFVFAVVLSGPTITVMVMFLLTLLTYFSLPGCIIFSSSHTARCMSFSLLHHCDGTYAIGVVLRCTPTWVVEACNVPGWSLLQVGAARSPRVAGWPDKLHNVVKVHIRGYRCGVPTAVQAYWTCCLCI